ncbi:MAG: HAD hydrolase family protein [Candidatus Alcyoniella australis]|nr:HAD hydrolase family protein [Candidatus Alcyoniella australis]
MSTRRYQLKPIAQLDAATACGLRALATDLDDTVTFQGKIPLENMQWLSRLNQAGIRTFAVTGRPAGFGIALTQYFDAFEAVIAENGGVICCEGRCDLLLAPELMDRVGPRLAEVFATLRERLPHLRPDPGTFARITEQVFMRKGLQPGDLELIERVSAENGLAVVTSSIMVHINSGSADKARSLSAVLDQRLGGYEPEQVITVGDSPNDSSMFDSALFPISAGVANIEDFAEQMPHLPAYIADLPQGQGFGQICERILRLREN